MSYNTKHLPQVHNRTEHSKGNGNHGGRKAGTTKHYNNVGMSYQQGMGCSRHDNCFTCPFSDCKFGNGQKTGDTLFMANKGDGIKVW